MIVGIDKGTANLIKWGLGILVVGGTGYYIYTKVKKKSDINKTVKDIEKNPTKQLAINIPSIASQIGVDMGYAFPIWDPRRATENDTEVMINVLKVPKPLIGVLISEYYKKYGRNLRDDLESKLDQWDKVSYLFS